MLHWEIMGLRAAIALLMLMGVGLAVLLGHEVLTPTDSLRAGPVLVEIPAHDGILAIAGRLYQAGAIRSRTGFVMLAVFRGTARYLKAGEYELDRGVSTVGVLSQLEAGRVKQHVVLQPEGATVAELARALEGERLASSAAVQRLASDPVFLSTVGIEAPSVEGYLFPDTYQFIRGMTAEEMLTRMVHRLRAKTGADIAARAAARGLTVHQLLTLASIIEREAVERDEMRTISAVFWNRLRLRMPLQADPTVQYATGKERRALTRADLRIDHPYNTYRNPGLPPGPIASPGLAAIEAALDPAPVKYLYFVAMDDTHHHFSATIAEHNAAVARYRLARAR
ncbi:MAG: endolytic transglycosylase MltG [Candidatus Rokuibacteriota bacterium]|nr:MAG: endolytic transglycosylase MltG [Candidatus Rokubacteria bacterium]